jgi:hypothetical protein
MDGPFCPDSLSPVKSPANMAIMLEPLLCTAANEPGVPQAKGATEPTRRAWASLRPLRPWREESPGLKAHGGDQIIRVNPFNLSAVGRVNADP